MVAIMWIVILIGIAKEIFDMFSGGTVELLDTLATILGGLVMYIILG